MRSAFKRSVREAFRLLMPEFRYPLHMNVRPRGTYAPSFQAIYEEMRSALPLHAPTLIIRHQRENRKKCSLTPLEKKPGFIFHAYPGPPPLLSKEVILLAPGAPPLSPEDAPCQLLLLDSTWHHLTKISSWIDPGSTLKKRSLPVQWKTAYPRCQEISEGLASIEALFAAYTILGWEQSALLDSYYWKKDFLNKNAPWIKP